MRVEVDASLIRDIFSHKCTSVTFTSEDSLLYITCTDTLGILFQTRVPIYMRESYRITVLWQDISALFDFGGTCTITGEKASVILSGSYTSVTLTEAYAIFSKYAQANTELSPFPGRLCNMFKSLKCAGILTTAYKREPVVSVSGERLLLLSPVFQACFPVEKGLPGFSLPLGVCIALGKFCPDFYAINGSLLEFHRDNSLFAVCMQPPTPAYAAVSSGAYADVSLDYLLQPLTLLYKTFGTCTLQISSTGIAVAKGGARVVLPNAGLPEMSVPVQLLLLALQLAGTDFSVVREGNVLCLKTQSANILISAAN